jgi:hypothetical protein
MMRLSIPEGLGGMSAIPGNRLALSPKQNYRRCAN